MTATTTIEQHIDRILSKPLVWPPFGAHEALFDGKVRVRILRAKLSKSASGSDMIWVEGVCIGTQKLNVPPSKYPEGNPEGWDCKGYNEEPDANGEYLPVNPIGTSAGPCDVTGHRFVYGGTLAEGLSAEMAINNLRFLGWRPERVKAPCTGTSLTDFIPADGADYVSAESLGMTDEFLAHFALKEPTGNFPAKIQLVRFSLLDVRVTAAEAKSLDDRFGFLLDATKGGKRYDSRKAEAAPAKRSVPLSSSVPVASVAPGICGKPCGPDPIDLCKEKAGHAGPCSPPPF